MPLTYQPFAQVPEVSELSRELRRTNPGNSDDLNQSLTLVGGAAFVLGGLATRGLFRWIYLFIGGALIQHALRPASVRAAELRPGVPGNQGARIESSVEINVPAQTLYSFWRDLSHLPKIMSHVKSVEELDGKRSHWTVYGPAGQTASWDAEVINEHPGKLIAWQTLPGALVKNAGSVWFEETEGGATRVKVALEFEPAGGVVGSAVAWAVKGVEQRHLAEDLQRFKGFAERELAGTAAPTTI